MTPSEHPLGTILHTDDGRPGLRYERRLAHPPEKVWRAITESRHLRRWLPCDIVGDRRAGAPLQLTFWPDLVDRFGIDEATLPGEVRVWDPPHVFEWTWDADVLRWELRAVDGGTLLTLTTWLGPDQPAGMHGTAAGWHVCLDLLVELVETGSVRGSLTDGGQARWEQAYADVVASSAAGHRTITR